MKLEIGYKSTFEVREEMCRVNGSGALTVLYLSDLHFNRYSGEVAAKLIDKIGGLNPDIILFGGDYVDSKKGLAHLIKLLQYLKTRPNVFAIAGNHDYFFGLEILRNLFTKNGVSWIENESIKFQLNGLKVRIDGNLPLQHKPDVAFNILCLHKPLNIQPYQAGYNLAFAGHLHGCQFVLLRREKRFIPAGYFTGGIC